MSEKEKPEPCAACRASGCQHCPECHEETDDDDDYPAYTPYGESVDEKCGKAWKRAAIITGKNYPGASKERKGAIAAKIARNIVGKESVEEAEDALKCLNCGHAAVIHGQPYGGGSTAINDPCLAQPKCSCPGLRLPGQRTPAPFSWESRRAARIVTALLTEAPKISFEEWLKKVDDNVYKLGGLSIHDLPDVPLRDWYEGGTGPAVAAARAVKSAMSGE